MLICWWYSAFINVYTNEYNFFFLISFNYTNLKNGLIFNYIYLQNLKSIFKKKNLFIYVKLVVIKTKMNPVTIDVYINNLFCIYS